MYSFYFGSLLLPVTPQKLTTKIKGNNKTLTLVNEGDINFLRRLWIVYRYSRSR